MDIKLKKWKSVVSFASFALGVSLALVSGISLYGTVKEISDTGMNPFEAGNPFDTDYQNTEEFRRYVENRLFDFIAMAAGTSPGYGYYYDYYEGYSYYNDYYSDYYGGEFSEATTTYTEEAEQEAGEGGITDAEWKELCRREADEYHESIKADYNLLYRVVNGKEEMYSNMEEHTWDDWEAPLPEGYNFALYFDGEKVRIKKDGAELDVYGDGYYDGDRPGSWRVPGYQNFRMSGTGQIQIYLLVAEKPLRYVYMDYGDRGYRQTSSALYGMERSVTEAAARLGRNLTEFAAGLLLLVVAFVWRKEKRQADIAIARVTGRIWFEWKLLLFAAVVTFDILFILGAVARDFGYLSYGTAIDVEADDEADSSWDLGSETAVQAVTEENSASMVSLSYVGEIMPEIFWELGYVIRSYSYLLLPLFWLCYLGINDIRRNKKTFWHGGVSRFIGIFQGKNERSSFAKELMRKTIMLGIADGIAMAAVILISGWMMEKNLGAVAAAVPMIFIGVTVLLIFLVHYIYLENTERLANDMDVLVKRIREIHDGDYASESEKLTETSRLYETSENLEGIRDGMEQAICERVKSEQMKVELVTNVSHDIKTPLTSIISYVQFLKQEEDLPEHVKDYIHILDEKAERLNHMVQDVFAVSKAAAGQLPVEIETLDFAKLLRQTLADMEEKIRQSAVRLVAELPGEPVLIEADGKRMYRVYQNLIDNALKYSLEGSRVFVTLKTENGRAVSNIKNISKEELRATEMLTERFVRGDASRTDGGSGLGLSIAKTFTEACGGDFAIAVDADLFVVAVTFREVSADGACVEQAGRQDMA